MRRLLSSFAALNLSLLAVAQAPQRVPDEAIPPTTEFRTGVRSVLAPTVVLDKKGEYISDLKPSEFVLLDEGMPQRITVETAEVPISMVVAMQANGDVAEVLPKMKTIGSLLESLVLGERGEAAILAFDHRFRVIQDFTHDGTKIGKALEKLTPGSSSSRMVDAVQESIRLLKARPVNHRKIILLISETKDNGSALKTREVLTNLEFPGITVYTINVSRLVTSLTKKPLPSRSSPIPPEAQGGLPGSAPKTPLAVEQIKGIHGNGIDFVPVFKELFTASKAIFVPNPAEVFTTYTGGKEFTFVNQKSLEEAFQKLSGELHNEYVLSFTPSNASNSQYHDLVVQVRRPNLEVRTRPGYWWAGVPAQ